ncbi:hypothetical protein JAVIER_158 [Vibrio phage Javier]|nr:hypothetical protein JAVIER_158 [Vibrio phage Javier]
MFNKQERKEIRGGIFQTFGFWVLIVCLFGGFGTLSHYLGMWGDTTMDRIITKNSFQYKEGMEQQAAIWESTLVELEEQRMQCQDEAACANIDGQIRMVNARLRAVTINK